MMQEKEYISVSQMASILGISRVAVHKKIKKGQIKAMRVGRNYIIHQKYIAEIMGEKINEKTEKLINAAVKKTLREYGDVIRRLGRE
jgi:excisionase family DNA binding protein